jgi:hypothetical protein
MSTSVWPSAWFAQRSRARPGRSGSHRQRAARVALELPTHVVDRKEAKRALDRDVAASRSTFGQHADDYISSVEQD